MKLCFVQPTTNYQVMKHRYALSLTFPQLVLNMGLNNTEYEVYYEGKTKEDFRRYIRSLNITHVLITSITSTFPNAVSLAEIAKEEGITTVLGGIFASTSSAEIAKKFSCFDCICTGKADRNFFVLLKAHYDHKTKLPSIYHSHAADNFQDSVADVLLEEKFTDAFGADETVCYEITQGCLFNCSFCTLRKAFGCTLQRRPLGLVRYDIEKLQYWKKIKLIDDDIWQSREILKQVSFRNFDEVIAETRIDHMSEEFIKIVSDCGITHLIVGIESFETRFLNHSNKSRDKSWKDMISHAIYLCQKYDLVLRPVIMLNYPGFRIDSAKLILENINGWTPDNNIELLISFYTPHPGIDLDGGQLLTNDLRYFDHLNLVYLPNSLKKESLEELSVIYDQIVTKTRSQEYNPSIKKLEHFIDAYHVFFL